MLDIESLAMTGSIPRPCQRTLVILTLGVIYQNCKLDNCF